MLASGGLFTARPLDDRDDFQNAYRIYLAAAALQSLKLRVGEPCVVLAPNGTQATVIAWAGNERPALAAHNVLISAHVQNLCSVKLGDEILVYPAPDKPPVARTLELQPLDPSLAAHNESNVHLDFVRRSLELQTVKSSHVWHGLIFKIRVCGAKVAYRLTEVNGSDKVSGIFKLDHATRLTLDPAKPAGPLESSPARLSVDRAEVGGLTVQLDRLDAILRWYSDEARQVQWPPCAHPFKGAVLLYGRSGTGKSLLLAAVAAARWRLVSFVDLKSLRSGKDQACQSLRTVFAEARAQEPSLIVIDQLELCRAGAPTVTSDMSTISALIADEVASLEKARVLVIGAIAEPRNLDSQLRRDGCFEHEIEVPVPDASGRFEILQKLTDTPSGPISSLIEDLSRRTHGYVGRDLRKLTEEATRLAAKRLLPVSSLDGPVTIEPTVADYEGALHQVRPSAMQDVFLEPPKVTWGDIGGQDATKAALREAIEWPFKYPELMSKFDAPASKGLLLYGPPGCSKTLTAAALANTSDLNFLAVKGAELLSMYVGESERGIRQVFDKARAAAPSILFFDEIDAIGASREAGSGSGSGAVSATVLTTLLNELDGIEALTGVFVLAATNRPESLDPALIRPGRLDQLLYIGLPDLRTRLDILQLRLAKMHPDATIQEPSKLEGLAQRMEGYSGAEVVRVCQRASHAAVRESLGLQDVAAAQKGDLQLGLRHFEIALDEVQPRTSMELVARLQAWGEQIR